MAEDLLIIASSPHVRAKDSVQTIMYSVAIALLPAVAAGVYFFGWYALAIVLVSVGAAVATEVIWQKLRKQSLVLWRF